MATDGGDRQDRGPLAERLNALFAQVCWTDAKGREREYSTADVAKAVTEDPAHSATLSRSYLAMLRNGSHTNPSLAVLEGLAKFFDDRRPARMAPIGVRRLVGGQEAGAGEDELLRRWLADHQVRTIAMRAGEMTPAMRGHLIRMIESFDREEHEGAPAPRDGVAGPSAPPRPEGGKDHRGRS